MEELVETLKTMCAILELISRQLEAIRGRGVFDSIADVCDKLDEIHTEIFMKF